MATYETYTSLAVLVEYLTASPRATAFLALAPDTQEMWMVEATRMLNRQRWAGTPTEDYPDDQPLAWPRDGISGVTDGVTPQAILDAFCELTLALYLDSSTLHQSGGGSRVKSLSTGGGVGVEFFGPATSSGRFPRIVQELIGDYLATAGGSSVARSRAGGTTEESQFEDCDAFDLSDGE